MTTLIRRRPTPTENTFGLIRLVSFELSCIFPCLGTFRLSSFHLPKDTHEWRNIFNRRENETRNPESQKRDSRKVLWERHKKLVPRLSTCIWRESDYVEKLLICMYINKTMYFFLKFFRKMWCSYFLDIYWSTQHRHFLYCIIKWFYYYDTPS